MNANKIHENTMQQQLTPDFPDYELIDTGDFEKLERFGRFVTRRPEPQAIWRRTLPEAEWQRLADASFLREIDETIKKESQYIRQSSYRYTVSRRKVLVIKPGGEIAEDERYYTSFAAQVIAERDGVVQTGSERRCMTLPQELFWKGATPLELAHTALRRALLMLEARPCPAGKMRVLMAGEAGGTIVHEACGHGLEADIVEKDYSTYRGKTGEKVAHETITMIDGPLTEGLYGDYRFDDEGTPAQRTVLIENGVLKNYLTDVLSSQLYDLPLTGNGRRESYRCVPVPRMSNTYLLPGRDDLDTMLARTERGLFVKKMGGGEVDPTSGDFVFYVSEAYLIEKGKLGAPVRGAILTGNGLKDPDTAMSQVGRPVEIGDSFDELMEVMKG